jgi:hypothetical protein
MEMVLTALPALLLTGRVARVPLRTPVPASSVSPGGSDVLGATDQVICPLPPVAKKANEYGTPTKSGVSTASPVISRGDTFIV